MIFGDTFFWFNPINFDTIDGFIVQIFESGNKIFESYFDFKNGFC